MPANDLGHVYAKPEIVDKFTLMQAAKVDERLRGLRLGLVHHQIAIESIELSNPGEYDLSDAYVNEAIDCLEKALKEMDEAIRLRSADLMEAGIK